MTTRPRKDASAKKAPARRGTRKAAAKSLEGEGVEAMAINTNINEEDGTTDKGNTTGLMGNTTMSTTPNTAKDSVVQPPAVMSTNHIGSMESNTFTMNNTAINQHNSHDTTGNNQMEKNAMNTTRMQGRELAVRERDAGDTSLDYLLSPPVRPKEMIRIVNAGAGRGAERALDAIAAFNRRSADREIVPVYADPVPGKAIALNREARRRGIRSGVIEAKAQDVVGTNPEDTAPLVIQLDRAADIAKILRETENTRQVTLGYLLVRDPRGRLLGIRFIVRPGDIQTRLQLAQFFEELGFVTLARGSSAVVGAEALPEHAAIEPMIRAWFAAHMTANIAKAVVDIEGDTDAIEITTDGEVTQPLILKNSLTWSGPEELAEEVRANFKGAIARGASFTVAEWVTGEGIRFYSARLRRTDGNISVQGAVVVNPSEFQRADLARAEAAEQRRRQTEALAALARAAQMAFTRTNPVMTTD